MTKPINTIISDTNEMPELGKTKFIMTEKSVSVTKDIIIAVLLDKFGTNVDDKRSITVNITDFIAVANEYEYPISIDVTPDLKKVTISSKVSS